jgi:hypothetical protein
VTKTLNGEDPGFKWRDLSDVSKVVKIRLKALERIGSSDIHNAATNLAVFWGLMVNANKVTFWLLLDIISSPTLLSTIRAEIAPFTNPTTSTKSKTQTLTLDVNGLMKSCPMLKATFYETMRLYAAGTSYKEVLQPVTLTESPEDAAGGSWWRIARLRISSI